MMRLGVLLPVVGLFGVTTDKDQTREILPDVECYECRISFSEFAGAGSKLEYRLTDSKRSRKMITDPIRLSRRDKDAKDFEVLGTMTLVSRGKKLETRSVTLFRPMGRFSIGPTYYIGNFNSLYKELKRSLK